MEIKFNKIPWGKWYISIPAIWLSRWFVGLFAGKWKATTDLLSLLLLILVIGYHLFQFIEWVNLKMLNRAGKVK